MKFFTRVLGKMRCYKVPVAVCETFAHDFSAHFRAVSRSRNHRAISVNLDTMGVNLSFSLSLCLCLCEDVTREKLHARADHESMNRSIENAILRRYACKSMLHDRRSDAFFPAHYVAIARIEIMGRSIFKRLRRDRRVQKLFVRCREGWKVFEVC